MSNLQDSRDKVQVVIRIRPLTLNQDPEQLVDQINGQTLKIVRPGNDSFMKFNRILGQEDSQADVFEEMKDSVESFLRGIDNTIFAYGQTGAGKTYTITGQTGIGEYNTETVYRNYLDSPQRGIVPRALQMVFDKIESRKESNSRVYLSFIEIYNEKVFDLLGEDERPLQVKTGKGGEIIVSDLAHHQVADVEEAVAMLVLGTRRRVTKATYAHAQSSRSHSVFEITYARTGIIARNSQSKESPVVSSLRVVDLAGSEKYKIPYNLSPAEKQIHVQQLTSINSSLSSLGHCISALGQRSRTHIPFRESKLTRILSESLTGKGRLKLIICVSPSISAAQETLSTLQFANRAKKAVIQRPKPEPTAKVSSSQFLALKDQLERERAIRQSLEQMLANKTSHSLVEQILQLKQQNLLLKQQLSQSTHRQVSPSKPSPTHSPSKKPSILNPGRQCFSSVSGSKQKPSRPTPRMGPYNRELHNSSSPDLQQPTASNLDIKHQLDLIRKAVQSNIKNPVLGAQLGPRDEDLFDV